MLNQGARALSLFFALSLVAVACGDDDDDGDPTASGGSSGKGSGGSSFGGAGRGGGGSTSGGTSGKGGTGGQTTGGGSNGGAMTTGGTSQGGAAGEGGIITDGGSTVGGTGDGGTAGTTGGVGPEGGSSGAGTGGSAGGVSEGGASGSVSTGGVGGAGGFGGDDSAGAGAGGAPVVADTLDNGGFETGWAATITGWTATGTTTAAGIAWSDSGGAHTGVQYLNVWAAAAYTVTVSQVVSPLPDGNYTLTYWYYGGTGAAPYNSQAVELRGFNQANPTAVVSVPTVPVATWPGTAITIGPVAVTSGQLEVAIVSDGIAESWSHFDDVVLTRVP